MVVANEIQFSTYKILAGQLTRAWEKIRDSVYNSTEFGTDDTTRKNISFNATTLAGGDARGHALTALVSAGDSVVNLDSTTDATGAASAEVGKAMYDLVGTLTSSKAESTASAVLLSAVRILHAHVLARAGASVTTLDQYYALVCGTESASRAMSIFEYGDYFTSSWRTLSTAAGNTFAVTYLYDGDPNAA